MKSPRTHIQLTGKISAYSALALALLTILAVPVLHADDASQPARAIRLSYVDGKVQLAQAGQVIAEQAVINTPLLEGMTLSTANDGKAEIQFEDGSVTRIAPNSTLTLSTLSGAGAAAEADMTVERGEAYFELQGNGQVGPMRVHFGDATATASGFTVLRVQFDTPPGAVAVFSGNAHLERGNSTFLDLRGGQSLTLNAANSGNYNLAETIESDSWDAWNSDRDQALNAESATQTSAPSDLAQGQTNNPAWSDLDANGSWYNVPGQGYVWSPYDASNAGFDPYGSGSWVWLPGFGYTWASGYSWGYMPFSCGAWNFYNGFGWGWAPGFGGCSPWWNTGFYGGPVIGFAPGWYHTVRRPPSPREGPGRGHPVPLIAVNRQQTGATGLLPPRDRNTPVTIGGATVVGLRTFPGRTTPRPGIVVRGFRGSSQSTLNNRPAYTAPRSTYNLPAQRGNQLQPARPAGSQSQPSNGFNPSAQPARVTTPPATQPSRPSAPPSRPSSGVSSGASRPSPAPSAGGGSHGGGSPSGGGHSGGGGGHR